MPKHVPAPAYLYKGHTVAFYCSNAVRCWHYVNVPVIDLIAQHGEDYDISSHAAKMRCQHCGTKGADIRFSWGGGRMDAAHLFPKVQRQD